MRFTRRFFPLLLILAAGLPAQDAVRTLTILHTNDLHAHLLPDDQGRGGFAALARAIRRERQGCTDCILLNAGDLVQGTPVSTIYKGLPIYEISNLFGYDAACLGNHEFDYGWQQVAQFIRTAKYPVVAANVTQAKEVLVLADPYVILKVGGLRVAVIGVVMGDLDRYTTPDKMGTWRARPVIPAVRKYAEKLRPQSDLIVVLGHLEDAEATQILHEVPEVSVVVSGHDHTGMKVAEEYQGRVNVRVSGYGRELGRLDLRVDVPGHKVASYKWRAIPIEGKIPPAEDIAALVGDWEAKVSRIVDVPIGEARREIAGPDLKRLIERAMMDETGADFAYMNQGGVRDKIPQGRVLSRTIWNVMPFDDQVVVGHFPGSKLPPVVLGGRKVDPNKEYALAVTDFTAANQNKPGQLETTGLVFPKKGQQLRDLLILWVNKKKVLE